MLDRTTLARVYFRRSSFGRFVAAGLICLLVAASVVGRAEAATSGPDPTEPDFATIAKLDELTGDHAAVFRLYRAYFGRQPDVPGALYWVEQHDRCLSLTAISDLFAASAEFERRYGSLDDTAFVTLVYRNLLGRLPDKTGQAYWLDLLQSGGATRGGVVLHFSLAAEFRAAHPQPSDDVPSRPCRAADSKATDRSVVIAAPGPFAVAASAGDLVLGAPAMAVERVGFHQSSHPGARSLQPFGPFTAPRSVMESRGRGTTPTGAADVAVHPSVPIVAPISGTVARAGEYRLYCRYTDGFVVINPAGQPGFEVKVLHVRGVAVEPGDRVEAGDRIAAGATPFPFRSQIDELTAEPSWPHVHIEVVDLSVPLNRRPSSC